MAKAKTSSVSKPNPSIPGGGLKPKGIATGKDDGTFNGFGNVKGALRIVEQRQVLTGNARRLAHIEYRQ